MSQAGPHAQFRSAVSATATVSLASVGLVDGWPVADTEETLAGAVVEEDGRPVLDSDLLTGLRVSVTGDRIIAY